MPRLPSIATILGEYCAEVKKEMVYPDSFAFEVRAYQMRRNQRYMRVQ